MLSSGTPSEEGRQRCRASSPEARLNRTALPRPERLCLLPSQSTDWRTQPADKWMCGAVGQHFCAAAGQYRKTPCMHCPPKGLPA